MGDADVDSRGQCLLADHRTLGRYSLIAEGEPEWLFAENETNAARLFDAPNSSRFVKYSASRTRADLSCNL
jgi:hypothetical protein